MAEETTSERQVGKKWSLWKSANIGLVLSGVTLLLQILNGRGYDLADYAHTPTGGTIGALLGQILAAPLIFVFIALVRNLFNRRQSASSASPVRGALIFIALFVGILAALFVCGEYYFSRAEVISGEARTTFVTGVQRSCVQKQASLNQAVTQEQINAYCGCVAGKMADITTYKQLGSELDPSALNDLRQKTEAIANTCLQ
ncbi:hypothetical protein [Rhizobium sp. RAF56]|uniref:hypothetical protein n=1 Tax=Rhizobium sp. RAF56 TaxID=3233062 RepID=UPI003F9D3292